MNTKFSAEVMSHERFLYLNFFSVLGYKTVTHASVHQSEFADT